MIPPLLVVWLVFNSIHATVPHREIDRCAQDGAFFYIMNDDPAQLVHVERDGISIRIEHPDPKSAEATLTFSHGTRVLVQNHRDFEAAHGWLTVSRSGAFATTWQENASSAETQLFRMTSNGGISEDRELIQSAEKTFIADAKHTCKTPGVNTTAIKWIDDDHLLLSVNAWSSGFCYSNFTEGFALSLSNHTVEKKMSEQELINLPAVCTWNLVHVKPRQQAGTR